MNAGTFPAQPIFVVDDDEDLQRTYGYVLRSDGINNLVQCVDSREVEGILTKREFEAVLLDLNMPDVSGLDLLPAIVQRHPDVPVIVVTGVDEVQTAVRCMKQGAFDYMVKPIDEGNLLSAIRRAIEVREMRRENSLLKKHLLSAELLHPEAFAATVTANKSMQALFQYVEAVAVTQQPILITGETGVGKELVADAIHRVSNRPGTFVAVNIAGLDENVFSDTLFGHVKGAFTGAAEARKGLIERATDGTLFLDEIGELSHGSQVKLLRLLQEGEYLPLGSDDPRHTNARIVVATNRRLQDLADSSDFRDDVYFRLRPHHVHVPPLRDRQDDMPLLVDHFLERAAEKMNKKKPTPPRELFDLLCTYAFPGNIRELEGMIYDAVSTHRGGILSLESFREAMASGPVGALGPGRLPARVRGEDGSLFPRTRPLPTIREAEELLISEALDRTKGNQTMAAELLGVTRQTLNRHLKRKRE